ncbi:MAG: porin family protein [Chlorobi bacterium]|nr:porin family protein [Chlorobiota bacterium]
MKSFMLYVITFSFFLFVFAAQAQTIKVGLGGGYTTITSSTSTFDSGFHYGGKVVVGLPMIPLYFTANLYSNPLSKEVAGITHESSFFSTGLGAELTLLPGPLKPYLAAEFLITSIGESKIGDVTYSESLSKSGLGLGAGVYFTLLPIIDLDLSAHYNMNTLLSSGDDLNSLHIRLNVLISIL